MSGVIDETLGTLRSYVLATFLPGEDPASLTDETPLISSGIIDSIAVLDMVTWIEKSFSVRLQQDDLGRERLDTITLIANLIAERRAS
jgi:acyl carrier protein